MKRIKTSYKIESDPANCDYDIYQTEKETQKNFESIEGWLYLGADVKNKNFAKIGITTGDLSSRSYSSSNPNYYIFCAFKCIYNITRKNLENIEKDILSKFDKYFSDEKDITKRASHVESKRQSECFYDIDFDDFLVCLHRELYECHSQYFLVGEYENDAGDIDGYILDCEFSQILSDEEKKKYRRLILVT